MSDKRAATFHGTPCAVEWGVKWPPLLSMPGWIKSYQSEEKARAAVGDSLFDGVVVRRVIGEWGPCDE